MGTQRRVEGDIDPGHRIVNGLADEIEEPIDRPILSGSLGVELDPGLGVDHRHDGPSEPP
jgi:hypothetical protein